MFLLCSILPIFGQSAIFENNIESCIEVIDYISVDSYGRIFLDHYPTSIASVKENCFFFTKPNVTITSSGYFSKVIEVYTPKSINIYVNTYNPITFFGPERAYITSYRSTTWSDIVQASGVHANITFSDNDDLVLTNLTTIPYPPMNLNAPNLITFPNDVIVDQSNGNTMIFFNSTKRVHFKNLSIIKRGGDFITFAGNTQYTFENLHIFPEAKVKIDNEGNLFTYKNLSFHIPQSKLLKGDQKRATQFGYLHIESSKSYDDSIKVKNTYLEICFDLYSDFITEATLSNAGIFLSHSTFLPVLKRANYSLIIENGNLKYKTNVNLQRMNAVLGINIVALVVSIFASASVGFLRPKVSGVN